MQENVSIQYCGQEQAAYCGEEVRQCALLLYTVGKLDMVGFPAQMKGQVIDWNGGNNLEKEKVKVTKMEKTISRIRNLRAKRKLSLPASPGPQLTERGKVKVAC